MSGLPCNERMDCTQCPKAVENSIHYTCLLYTSCNDEYSIGCNNLIRKNQAVLITSAEDLVKAMGWESSPKTEKTVQRELFPDLSEEEERIVKRLGKMSEVVSPLYCSSYYYTHIIFDLPESILDSYSLD